MITICLVACRTETAAAQDTVGHDVPFLLLVRAAAHDVPRAALAGVTPTTSQIGSLPVGNAEQRWFVPAMLLAGCYESLPL